MWLVKKNPVEIKDAINREVSTLHVVYRYFQDTLDTSIEEGYTEIGTEKTTAFDAACLAFQESLLRIEKLIRETPQTAIGSSDL